MIVALITTLFVVIIALVAFELILYLADQTVRRINNIPIPHSAEIEEAE
jgi:hypothetical protein